jgi:hypothetical protein
MLPKNKYTKSKPQAKAVAKIFQPDSVIENLSEPVVAARMHKLDRVIENPTEPWPSPVPLSLCSPASLSCRRSFDRGSGSTLVVLLAMSTFGLILFTSTYMKTEAQGADLINSYPSVHHQLFFMSAKSLGLRD